MTDINALKAANANRWNGMQVTANRVLLVNEIADRLLATSAQNQYKAVQAQTTVPWFVIAVIHERESSQSWTASLAQGDPWNQVSVHVPRGIGPFDSWQAAAIYTLTNCRPLLAHWDDWSIGGMLTALECENGLGYAERGLPSPYVWASTNQYIKGKYVADGHYDPDAIDTQIGCAALLWSMAEQDPEIAS